MVVLASIIVNIVMLFLMFIIFMITFKLQHVLNKFGPIKDHTLEFLSMVGFLILYTFNNDAIGIFCLDGLLEISNYAILITTVLLTSIVICFKKREPQDNIGKWVLNGILMEIPQRLFMQNLIWIVLLNITNIKNIWIAICINAFLWCELIVAQEIMLHKRLERSIAPEIISSFCFSLGVGYLYLSTGNIIFPALAHGLERFVSEQIRRWRSA